MCRTDTRELTHEGHIIPPVPIVPFPIVLQINHTMQGVKLHETYLKYVTLSPSCHIITEIECNWFVHDKLTPLSSIWWALKRAQEGRRIKEIKAKCFGKWKS